MKSRIKDQVLEMYVDGQEPAEIVKAFYPKVSQSTVYRWIDELEKEYQDTGLKGKNPPNNSQSERKAVKTATATDDLNVLAVKRKTVKSFHKTFMEIKAFSDGYNWEPKHLKKICIQLERLQDQIEEIMEYDQEVFENNAMWVVLDDYIEFFQGLILARGTVELNLGTHELDNIEYYLSIDDFDQEFDWEGDFKRQYDYFLGQVSEFDCKTLSPEVAWDLKYQADELLEVLSNYDLEDDLKAERKHLKEIVKKIESCAVNAENSFWQSAELKLD